MKDMIYMIFTFTRTKIMSHLKDKKNYVNIKMYKHAGKVLNILLFENKTPPNHLGFSRQDLIEITLVRQDLKY